MNPWFIESRERCRSCEAVSTIDKGVSTASGESTIDFAAAMMTAELKACIDKQVADASAAMSSQQN